MDNLLKKSKKALREGGAGLFLKKLYGYSVVKIRLATAFILRPVLIKKIKGFTADNPEDIFSFFQDSSLADFIRPMQVKSEFVGLLNIFKERNPKTILEIGTANGGTLFCFSRLAPDDATIISVDLPFGAFGGGYPKNKIPLYSSFKKKDQKMFLLREDSHAEQTLEEVKEILKNRPLDFLFIDGDHTYEGVKRDFELYSPLVSTSGVVAFHDIAVHPENLGCLVNVFWDEIKTRYPHKEFIEDKKQGWGGVGVLFF